MATNFSEGGPSPAPKQFRAGPGQIGEAAALRQPRQRDAAAKRTGGSGARRERIGAPPVTPPQEAPTDSGHLMIAIEHEAAKTLGRDLPLPLWRQHNGAHDHPYYDYLSES
jgi:hypothetical protein